MADWRTIKAHEKELFGEAPPSTGPSPACPICCADRIANGTAVRGEKCPACRLRHTDSCTCVLCREAATSEGATPSIIGQPERKVSGICDYCGMSVMSEPNHDLRCYERRKSDELSTLRARLAEVERERVRLAHVVSNLEAEINGHLKIAAGRCEAAEARVEELEKAIRHIPIDLKCPASHFRATGCIGDKCKACGLPMVPVNNDLRAALQHGGEEKGK